jgi:hypothetical protein
MDLENIQSLGTDCVRVNNPLWVGTELIKVPQPMDVYAYTLEATFFDGTKTRRKGDITLDLR